ncbi:MAG: RNA-binding S4 domain-containing protein [Saccharofermentanales bacterium]
MRLDKFLKVSRIIKRRTVANEISSNGRVLVNSKTAKPGTEIKVGDIIEIKFGTGTSKVKVLSIVENVRKEDSGSLYEICE